MSSVLLLGSGLIRDRNRDVMFLFLLGYHHYYHHQAIYIFLPEGAVCTPLDQRGDATAAALLPGYKPAAVSQSEKL